MIRDLWFRLRWRLLVRRPLADRLAENPHDREAAELLIEMMRGR